jgi:PRTRC genetic system protein B
MKKNPATKQYDLGPLRPFSFDEMNQFVSAINQDSGFNFRGMIPRNVLGFKNAAGNQKLTWHVPAANRQLYFTEEELDGTYEVPHMIFQLNQTGLFVYLVKKRDVKKMYEGHDIPLHNSHFYNVYDDCKVCIGNGYHADFISTSPEENMEKTEFTFFEGSKFSHPHYKSPQLISIWKQRKGVFPENQWEQIAMLREIL